MDIFFKTIFIIILHIVSGISAKNNFKIKFCEIKYSEINAYSNFIKNNDLCQFMIHDYTANNSVVKTFVEANRNRSHLLLTDLSFNSEPPLSEEILKMLQNFDGIYVKKFYCKTDTALLPWQIFLMESPPSCPEYFSKLRSQLKTKFFVVEINNEVYFRRGLIELLDQNFDYVVVNPISNRKVDNVSVLYIKNLQVYSKLLKKKLIVSAGHIKDSCNQNYLWGVENVTNFLFSFDLTDLRDKNAEECLTNFGKSQIKLTKNVSTSVEKSIYCYYPMQLIMLDEISNIPQECNLMVIEGMEFINNSSFIVKKNYETMLQLFEKEKKMPLIASIKCDDEIGSSSTGITSSLDNLAKFVNKYNLDGIELNCKFLKDISKFESFIQRFKNLFKTPKLMGIRMPPCKDLNDHAQMELPVKQFNRITSFCDISISVLNQLDYVATFTIADEYFYKNKVRYSQSLIQKGLIPDKVVDLISAAGIHYFREIEHKTFRSDLFEWKIRSPGTFSRIVNFTSVKDPTNETRSFTDETIELLIYDSVITRNQICKYKNAMTLNPTQEYNFHFLTSRMTSNDSSISYDDDEIIKFLISKYLRNGFGGIAFHPLMDGEGNECEKEKYSILQYIKKRFKN